MFRRKNKPEAIRGDLIGEALVEVRDRIEQIGWTTGGQYSGEFDPMCLGNHVAVVASKREENSPLQVFRSSHFGQFFFMQPWTMISTSPLAIQLVQSLGFPHIERLWGWNDSFFSKRKGKKVVLKRVNEAIVNRNAFVISQAEVAAARKKAEDVEHEKLYVPAEWKPRTVSGEDREKVNA